MTKFNKIQWRSTHEKNTQLDIIKDHFLETKNNILENKEKFNTYIKDVESIEQLLSENKIDDAKSQATTKLTEVTGLKSLEDRLYAVITTVDEKISTAQAEILKYATDLKKLDYAGMYTFDNDSGVFAEVKELQGKTMYRFEDNSEIYSNNEYVYDENTNDVFLLKEGQVFWMNNGNIHLNKEEVSTSTNKITKEEAEERAIEYFLSFNKYYTINDLIASSVYDNDKNEYIVAITQNSGNYKVVAEFRIDANTKEIKS